MIKKIISGGQTGADRAALDFALKYFIPHGGWIPKGRLTENGPLADNYQLEEMPTASYPARTEQNVIDSDGTLIFSRGKPTGGTDYTRKMVLKHKKQLLGIDLNLTASYDAAKLLSSWIDMQHINILNVAGPRTSKDPAIYHDVFRVLEMANIIQGKGLVSPIEKKPRSVGEAVERLIRELSLKDKSKIVNMTESELLALEFTLGTYIDNEFGIYTGNRHLIFSSKQFSGDVHLHPDSISPLIIKELRKRLKESHRLRILKG